MTGAARKRVGAKAFVALLAALVEGPQSYADLVAVTGLAQPTLSGWVAEMRKSGMVRVVGWDNDSRGYPTIARFAWGQRAQDCPRPAMSGAERQQRWRDRQQT